MHHSSCNQFQSSMETLPMTASERHTLTNDLVAPAKMSAGQYYASCANATPSASPEYSLTDLKTVFSSRQRNGGGLVSAGCLLPFSRGETPVKLSFLLPMSRTRLSAFQLDLRAATSVHPEDLPFVMALEGFSKAPYVDLRRDHNGLPAPVGRFSLFTRLVRVCPGAHTHTRARAPVRRHTRSTVIRHAKVKPPTQAACVMPVWATSGVHVALGTQLCFVGWGKFFSPTCTINQAQHFEHSI
ncbi:unnamed protein product [Mesocestoides corti]|uniref:Peptidase S1 domain-containing protein n=1 Tax=Mesocestoides corti TaxID=53468 RepID=A0A158QWA2_MESCO|nr:unnamed protein product [Mesocestoides corti]